MSCSKSCSATFNNGQEDLEEDQTLIDLTCDETEEKQNEKKTTMTMKKKNKNGLNKWRKITSHNYYLCKICLDVLPKHMVWSCFKCKQLFCDNCLQNHVMQKFQDNDFGHGLSIKCPEGRCKEMLKPEDLRGVIPMDVYERWEDSRMEINTHSFWYEIAEGRFYSMSRPLFSPNFSPKFNKSSTDVVDLD